MFWAEKKRTSPQSSQKVPSEQMGVAYIMSRFPKLTETFILREMLEMEKQGQPILILPLFHTRERIVHMEVEYLRSRVHYTPFISAGIIGANFYYLWRSPHAYGKILWSALKGTWGSGEPFIGAIAIFPKSVYLARMLEEREIRHVHAHFASHPAMAAMIISELIGIGFSFTAHAHDIFVSTEMLVEKIRKARFVVAISTFNKEYLQQICRETAPAKVKVIHCGVELERYARQQRPLKKDRFTILCVASLKQYKGIAYLVRACALLKPRFGNFRCLIAGEGKEQKHLEHLIADLELKEVVNLVGGQTQNRIASLLADADLFVLPSVVAFDGQMEGIPVALMEAMASGLPVVATRLSGVPELVQDRVTGLLVPPADERALAEAIGLLYENEHLRREIADRGRQRVIADFQLDASVSKLRSLFSVTLRQESEIRNWNVKLIEEIRKKIRQQFPDISRQATPVDIRLRRQTGGWDSEVYQVVVQNIQCDVNGLILKLHRPARTGPENRLEQARKYAQREFDALSFLWGEFCSRSKRFTVPRPLDVFPQFAGLLIEKCQGERLDHALRWASLLKTRFQQMLLCRDVRACGEWLGLFHQITERSGNPCEVYKRIESDFECELNTCCELGVDSTIARRVAIAFQEKKDVAFTGDHKIVGTHGDFGPYNVFCSSDRLAVVDFQDLPDGTIYNDLCYFLGMIDLLSLYHLKPELCDRIKQSFLAGYMQHNTIDSKQLNVFMMATMVKIIAHHPLLQALPSGWISRWRRTNQLRYYDSWFERRVN